MTHTKNNPLSSPVQYVKGIGEKRAQLLDKAGVKTVHDLLYYVPRRYLDRSTITKIKDLREGREVTVVGRVESRGIKTGRKPRFIVILSDGTGFLHCVWFNRLEYWAKVFEVGEIIAFSGRVTYFGGFQLVHPEYDRLSDDKEDQFLHTGMIIPLYPSTEELGRSGLDSRGFRKIIKGALNSYLGSIEDILSEDILHRKGLMPLKEAIKNVHFPSNFGSLRKARERLKFDELFYLELMLAYRKKQMGQQHKGIEFKLVGERTRSLVEKLPFQLTEAQKKVLREIRADMKQEKPMYRLIQGDVGSGKTIVALVAMLMAVENGYQAALMAPTEILAEQHYLTTHKFLEDLGVKVALLVGGQRKTQRDEVLEAVQSGEVEIVIGTHALIQEGVTFKKLGLVIIDEQHRFGVMQRATLREKGLNPDVLIMTATPIPRTLSLTVYGDLDVSIIDELPEGRRPVKTYWRYDNKRPEIYQFVKERVAKGQQAYIVFPLVEESEKSDLLAATESYEKLSQEVFSDFKMALLHGRMKNEEKEAIMESFKNGETQILVTTTVIEVGVDVPQAIIMVVEHAERFGLTQLHQLRGRVGRGQEQAYCILIAQPPVTEEALTRLNTMIQTNDGFKIAEVDLKLRGPGEFFGTRQHGLPELRMANILEDTEILLKAREEAFHLVQEDPQLLADSHKSVRDHFVKNYRDKFGLLSVG